MMFDIIIKAVERGDLQQVIRILDSGANVNVKTDVIGCY
jgi:hypothetical protein